jgi:uncharacterized Zn-finger protein
MSPNIEWPCPLCDTPFSSDEAMEAHRETCTGAKQPFLPPELKPKVKKKGEDITITKVKEPPKPQPPVLTYKYEGRCKVKEYLAIVISNGKKYVSFSVDEFKKEVKKYSKDPTNYSLLHKADLILKVGVEEIAQQYNKWAKESL